MRTRGGVSDLLIFAFLLLLGWIIFRWSPPKPRLSLSEKVEHTR
ncbi:hypothetical protein [Catalinimonas alkaloidigena]|nr:hypothetical protein [Catalinimonas alkaloidigena]